MNRKDQLLANWNRLNGELFGELVFHEIADEHRDTYVIGFARQLERSEFRLESYYLNDPEQSSRPVHHYPQTLSELREVARQDQAIDSFVCQLDPALVDQLISAGMDSLAAYALIYNHPPLKSYLSKPLVLMAAYIRLYRFEKVIQDGQYDFTRWFPKLFFKQKLSKGTYRALSRVNTNDPKLAVSAAEYIIRNYPQLRFIMRGNGPISPSALREAIFALGQYPELVNAKWFYVEQFRDAAHCRAIAMLYYHTKLLLTQAGVENMQHTVLRQITTIQQLEQIHDRYVPQSLNHASISASAKLPNFGIADNEHFSVLNTAGELMRIAEEFENCAAIFVHAAVEGRLLHARYHRGDTRGLLQINTTDPNRPFINEFKGPRNINLPHSAWSDVVAWIKECAPRNGFLSYTVLISTTESHIGIDQAGEPKPRYFFG